MIALHNFFMYPIGGYPLWGILLGVLIVVGTAAVRAAKWTTAQDAIQITARFLLKFPMMGPLIASFPVIGEVLHFIADDVDNLPPTLTMRAMGKVPPKAPPPAVVAVIALCFFACAHVKAALIDFGKCELGQAPAILTGLIGEVDKTLGGQSPNWAEDMEALGKKAGMEAINCAVASVLYSLAAKRGALDDSGKRKSERGQIWLAGHKVAL